ncbi:cell division protein FtsL [Lactobacillus corticis]|uniref:Cell division protein FtsL n=1 Tax=Lactobacillus corticis TaxID=2201249 RepID=A0A916QJG8_9LACO|nr:cell division protein FtsL [Lactobacillus corticis]GFZ27728.1 cell division protein FtsL [Lactobacillus corticis]
MADTSARRLDLDPEKNTEGVKQTTSISTKRVVRFSPFEKAIVLMGSVTCLVLATLCVTSSNSATSTQSELTNVQQKITKQQNKVTDLERQIGELTSSSRLNKIAKQKGLKLIEKNIRTIR